MQFMWYRSQIQVSTHERNIVSCIKNIGARGERRPYYLGRTKTERVGACLFSITCSWLDLTPLHGESRVINVCTMSDVQRLGIHLVVFEGKYIIRWYQFQHSACHSIEWRNIFFELQNNGGFELYRHHGAPKMWVPTGTHFSKWRTENTESVKSSFYYVTVHRPASYLKWRSPFTWVAYGPGFVAGAHHFGTESLLLVCKRDMYLGDIWRAYCSAYWTLHVQSTEWNMMFTTRNEPLKYGPDEDHYILQGVSSRISLAFNRALFRLLISRCGSPVSLCALDT